MYPLKCNKSFQTECYKKGFESASYLSDSSFEIFFLRDVVINSIYSYSTCHVRTVPL